jgi:hypothetical protein
MKHFVLLSIIAGLCLFPGCKDEVSKTIESSNNSAISVSLTNLPALSDSLIYKVWIYFGETIIPKPLHLYTFRQTSDNVAAQFNYSTNASVIAAAKYIVVTIESAKDSLNDTLPSVSKILSGTFQVNAALLSTGHPFSISLNLAKMGGTFRLLTPGITNNDTSGIWFADIDSNDNYIPSLNISGQTDTSGWKYEIFVTQNGQTFSLGSFIDPLGTCDDSTYSGTLPIRLPGQNLVQNPPAGLNFPISLAGAVVSIYVRPVKGKFKDLPGLKLLTATIPSVIQQKLQVTLSKADQNALPAGLMQVVIK